MGKKKEPQEQPITDISVYMAALQMTYRPASTPAEATHFFSTEEVVQAHQGDRLFRQSQPYPSVRGTPTGRLRLLQSARIPRTVVQMDVS